MIKIFNGAGGANVAKLDPPLIVQPNSATQILPMTDILDLIKSGLGGVTLTVTADDLANLVAKSIEAAKAELVPILASQTEEALLTREEVREKFGVCYGTLWNWSKQRILVPIKIGRKVRYRFSDVSRVISERGLRSHY